MTTRAPLIILPDASGDAATNMAIDMALLHTLPRETAVFRHYGWTEPTVTLGYTQRINEVQTLFSKNVRLCRRPTGGGIVDHREDWTYALVLNSGLSAAQIPATELYATLHECIRGAFRAQSLETQLAPCPRTCEQKPMNKPTGPSQCFALPSASDVIHPDGKKIAGAAMKRTREGLLVQGSINRRTLPEIFDFQSFSQDFSQSIAVKLDITLKETERFDELLDQTSVRSEYHRFKSQKWISKR